jgi:hypothetical protein
MNLGTDLVPQMLPHIQAVAQALNPQSAPSPYTLSPGSQRYDGDNKMVASAPVSDGKPQLIKTENGYAWATPGQSAMPVQWGAGAPQGQPSTSVKIQEPTAGALPAQPSMVQQANAMLAKGMQPADIMKQMVGSGQGLNGFSLSIDPRTNQFVDSSAQQNASASAQQPSGQAMGPGNMPLPQSQP